MNDWERLHRQAERYKQSYPPGTRVMTRRITDTAQSYDEALGIIGEYVNITSVDDYSEDMDAGMEMRYD